MPDPDGPTTASRSFGLTANEIGTSSLMQVTYATPKHKEAFNVAQAAAADEPRRNVDSQRGALLRDAGRVPRGGTWYHEDIAAFISFRIPSEPTFQDTLIGARLCASYPLGAPGPRAGDLNRE